MENRECRYVDGGVYDCEDYYDDVVSDERLKFLDYIDNNVVGGTARFDGPFGERQVVYCDYTASGRPLKFIEEYIMKNVYPHYGNTHTTTTIVSKQTTRFRNDAREIIKNSVNAGSDDVVIFCGSGATGAIHKIYQVMQLTEDRARKTVVFVGPFEHHSNILPWKESGAKVIRIKETKTGTVDVAFLEEQLKNEKKHADTMIGVFSSASNVTGILTDTEKVAELLHKHGALSFWDYATAGPYLKIDMNPVAKNGMDCSKDAVFISCHKFVGGVGTPGLLIAKRKLFTNRVPASAGGGTVSYVSREKHYYLKDIEAREEGGTPAITESIRAGMAFQVKEAVGSDVIEAREEELCRRAFDRWQNNKNLIILGNQKPRRLPIFSFMIRHEKTGKLLHHNFVCTLLNDLYGIQARGGCACAGPYAHDLLGITEQIADRFIRLLDEDRKQKENKEPLEALRPGFSRINLPYFMHDAVIDYVLDAIDQLANHGWKLLPLYRFNPTTGAWEPRHEQQITKRSPGYMSLFDINFEEGWFDAPCSFNMMGSLDLKTLLADADAEYNSIDIVKEAADISCDPEFDQADVDEGFQWFLQPRDALVYLTSENLPDMSFIQRSAKLPIRPRGHTDSVVPDGLQREISVESGYGSEELSDFEFDTVADDSVENSIYSTVPDNDICEVSKKRKLDIGDSGFFDDSILSDSIGFNDSDINVKSSTKKRRRFSEVCYRSSCKHEQCLCESCFSKDNNKLDIAAVNQIKNFNFTEYTAFDLS
ncbi:uncharacterized protein LOC144450147 [Glandiceps talaboti]